MTSFYDVIKIKSQKTCHQNDVTRNFHFQAPPLAKSWLRSYLQTYVLEFVSNYNLQQKSKIFT